MQYIPAERETRADVRKENKSGGEKEKREKENRKIETGEREKTKAKRNGQTNWAGIDTHLYVHMYINRKKERNKEREECVRWCENTSQI